MPCRAGALLLTVWGALANVAPAATAAAQRPATSATATTPAAAASVTPAIVSQGRIDPAQGVNFSAMAIPPSVYVGQQVTYQIGVFLSEDVSQRLRRNPEFVPPDVRSMLAYDLPSSARPLQRMEGGRAFDVHVFQRALFPLTPGQHVLAPARLTYSLPLSNTFFSREETHSARTSSLTVLAKEPPVAGRPGGYNGAVGRLSLSARVDAATSRVGDPVTLVVSVRGVGNVSLFPRPRVALPWGDAVQGAERVTVDSGTALVQGRKDFEWVVTPRREGALEVPALQYPYWNPYTEQYEIAATSPLPLQVRGGALAARLAQAQDPVPRLALRPRYRGPLPLPWAQSPVVWALLGIVPIPALALGLRHRPRQPRREAADAPLLRLAESGRATAADVRRAYATAIARRIGVEAAAMSERRALVRRLRHAGVSAETAQRAHVVLADLDHATYGGGAPLGEGAGQAAASAADLARRAAETFAAIDQEAIPVEGEARPAHRYAAPVLAAHGRRTVPSDGSPPGASTPPGVSTSRGKSSRGGRTLLLAVGLALGAAATLVVADEALDQARFERGVEFYDQGDYQASMREFRDLVDRVPRAADAWANLGTAAWYAEDSASAAIGWQRALRLEPLAGDVRTRLEATPGFRAGLFGDVPPVPVDAAAALGFLSWGAGWGVLALALARGRRDLRTPSLSAIAGGVLLGILSVALADSLSGRRRVVVTEADRLRSAPALGADAASTVMTGEGATQIGAQGVWSRVRFADGRTGWMETRRLASLDVSRAP